MTQIKYENHIQFLPITRNVPDPVTRLFEVEDSQEYCPASDLLGVFIVNRFLVESNLYFELAIKDSPFFLQVIKVPLQRNNELYE